MKTCKKCLRHLAESSFHKDNSRKDGLRIYCKDCRAISGRDYRRRNAEQIRIKKQTYRRSSAGKSSDRRCKARRRNLGYKLLNAELACFSGIHFEGHHIDTEHVLLIPTVLHKGIAHSQEDPFRMELINICAENWWEITKKFIYND